MDIKNAEEYLESTLLFTQRMYQRHLERELTIEGISKRLSQFTEVAYLGVMLSIFPVTLYNLGNVMSYESPPRAIIVEKADFLIERVSDGRHISYKN